MYSFVHIYVWMYIIVRITQTKHGGHKQTLFFNFATLNKKEKKNKKDQ